MPTLMYGSHGAALKAVQEAPDVVCCRLPGEEASELDKLLPGQYQRLNHATACLLLAFGLIKRPLYDGTSTTCHMQRSAPGWKAS